VATVKFRYRTGEKPKSRPLDAAPGATASTPQAAEEGPAVVELKPLTVDRWWRESSYDLWQGLEVKEEAPDTIPGEWLDDLDRR
jgi:hypothetical protein